MFTLDSECSYFFLLSLSGPELTAGECKAVPLGGVNVYVFSYHFTDESDLHLLLRTSDWIIATRLHSYSLGNFALVLFCSVLGFSFECVCVFVGFVLRRER